MAGKQSLCSKFHNNNRKEALEGCARVGRALGGVDKLISEALRDGLDVAEGRLPRPCCQQIDGLIYPAEG